jgi:hypothetical protein
MALACITALATLLAMATTVRAQTDNFNSDGAIPPRTNAAPGWATCSLGNNPDWGYYGAAIFSFPTNPASAGDYAYRMVAPAITNDSLMQGLPRAGSFRTEQKYGSQGDGSHGRFFVGSDLISWNTNSGYWRNELFGVCWYASNTNVMGIKTYLGGWGPDLGTLIIITVDLSQGMSGLAIIGVAAPENTIELDPTHQYRMKASSHDGATFLLQLFDLAQPNSPWISSITYDTTCFNTPGYCGLLEINYEFPPPLGNNTTGGADATYDNYVAYLPAANTMPATVTDLAPQPGAKVSAYSYPTVNVGILNRDTTVLPNTIGLYLDGVRVPANSPYLSISNSVYKPYNSLGAPGSPTNFDGATVYYTVTNAFAFGSLHTNMIVFQDYLGGPHTWFTNTWSWTATALSPFATNGTLSVRGFNARMVHSTAAHIAANLVANGDFTATVGSFEVWPGYSGGVNASCPGHANPGFIQNWTEVAGGINTKGLNGAGTGTGCNSIWQPVDSPFAPASSAGYTFLFIQGGGGNDLGQYLTGLAPGTTYQLSYDVASRSGNAGIYQVLVATDLSGSPASKLYDSGAVAGNPSAFQHVTASFTTPATLTGTENIQLLNVSGAGDNTVDFANVTILPASYTSLPNSVASAQAVLAGQYAVDLASTNIVQTVNWGIVGNEYPGVTNFPGLCANAAAYSNSFAVEVMAYVQLAAGTNVFYVGHDNAVGIYSGTNVTDTSVVLLENNSPAYDTFNWVVLYPGLYPLHVIYEQGIGPAYLNLSTVNLTANTTNLVNTTGSVPAYYWSACESIITQPASQTNTLGTTATFSVVAAGSQPLYYQWQFNGTNLANNARISGSQTNSLTIANVLASDAGSYQVIITNACGSTNSAVATLTVTSPPVAGSVSDNFDSGALNPAAGWAQVTNPNFPYANSFLTDVFGGHAFRLQALVPLSYSSGTGTARAVAVVTNQTYTNFYVAADLVNWNSSNDKSTNDQYIALLARASGIDTGLITAMIMLFEPNNRTQTSPPGPSVGALSVGWVTGGDLTFLTGTVPCNFTYASLVPGHSYRLVFQGTGNEFTGQIYDLQDLTSPLMTVIGDNSIGAALGAPPLPTSGYSGMLVENGDVAGVADATFDNFVAAAAPPTSVSAPAVPHGLAGAPQVVNRTPASWANFYPAASGITFNATTLTTTNSINTNAIGLILNGVDVSSSLTITGPATNATVSFHGLASNCVYDASIQLQDMAGHQITNAWTFDTFGDAYLASANCLNIECEDYDYGGGQFINNPAPSGFATNDNYANVGIFPYATPLYADPSDIGYVTKIGNPANPADHNYTGTPPFDFYAYNTAPDYGGIQVDIPQCEFRVAPGAANGDSVGTEEGAAFDIYGWHDLTQTL